MGRELSASAFRAVGQQLSAAVRPITPSLVDGNKLVNLAMAFGATNLAFVHR
jgi:hypothetical protein